MEESFLKQEEFIYDGNSCKNCKLNVKKYCVANRFPIFNENEKCAKHVAKEDCHNG